MKSHEANVILLEDRYEMIEHWTRILMLRLSILVTSSVVASLLSIDLSQLHLHQF